MILKRKASAAQNVTSEEPAPRWPLPLLDAMIPAATATEKTAAKPVRRLGYVFMPMGCDNSRWIPKGGEKLEELSPILSSLEPVKQDITVLSNMELAPAYPGSHATSNSAFLSCAKAKVTESTDYYLGTTADQIAAQHIGQETQLPSLELAMDLLKARRPVRQRLRLRLPKQPLLVVPDDAAARRGASANRFRDVVWRRRHEGRAQASLRKARQSARLGWRRDREPASANLARPTAKRFLSILIRCAKSNVASRRPRLKRRILSFQTWIGPWACRPRSPITRD